MNLTLPMELPSDLVEEILSWTPSKSLVRLKPTCKHWETLISEPSFIMKHLSNMRRREQQFAVFNDVSNSETPWLSTVSCVGVNNDLDETNEPNMNIQALYPLPFSNVRVQSVYHCDGLLLFVTKNNLLVLNPLLKQARWVKLNYRFTHHSSDAYGLGYIGNDYKMVRLRCGSSDSDSSIKIYEFKSDRWKVVIDKTFGGFSEPPESSVCLKGTPYWVGYVNGKTFPTIQSFDFSRERFATLFLPPSSTGSSKLENSFSLGVFRGDKLFLLHKSCVTGKTHLWVMKKHWSKLLTFDIPKPLRFPKYYSCCFIEKFGKLVLTIRDLYSVDVYIVGMDGKGKFVQDASTDATICTSVCDYVPSLLPVSGLFEAKKKVEFISKRRCF